MCAKHMEARQLDSRDDVKDLGEHILNYRHVLLDLDLVCAAL